MSINFTYYKPKLLISIILALEICVSFILIHLNSYPIIITITPTTVIFILLYFYDKCLWRFPVFNQLNTVPNLNGHYEGYILYNFNDEDGKKKCVLDIKQTCSSIKVTSSFTKEGEHNTKSNSNVSFIKTDEHGDKSLYFYYHNEGSCIAGNTLEQHDGFNIFKINMKKKDITLEGNYFTNRAPQTKGRIEVTKIH